MRPTTVTSKSTVLSGEDARGKAWAITVGPVKKKGKDLPLGKNLADYIDPRGRMNLVKFFTDHPQSFPTLLILARKEASRVVTEVGCERFFLLSGYISAPQRSRLGVRTYERLDMMSSLLQTIHVDDEWLAREYLWWCKAGCGRRRTPRRP